MPIVIVEDLISAKGGYGRPIAQGGEYPFSNRYKEYFKPGTLFLYQRRKKRSGRMTKGGKAEYCGYGRLGEVRRDGSLQDTTSKRDWSWISKIECYLDFPKPISWKRVGESQIGFSEAEWSGCVRKIPQDVYDKIMRLAGAESLGERAILSHEPSSVVLQESVDLMIPRRTATQRRRGQSGGEVYGNRHSAKAAEVGRMAERLALRYITEHSAELGASNIRWVANEGLTPGWDIEYDNAAGHKIAVEVKGSVAPRFPSIDITIGEWKAAMRLREHYWLYLIASCLAGKPLIQRIQDPATLLEAGRAQLLPIVFRLSLLECR